MMVHRELEVKWFMLSAAEMRSRVLIKNRAVRGEILNQRASGSNPGCIILHRESSVRLFSFPVLSFVKWVL